MSSEPPTARVTCSQLSQPSGTMDERRARAKANPRLFINRDIFRQLSAAREVEFEAKLPTLKTPPPAP